MRRETLRPLAWVGSTAALLVLLTCVGGCRKRGRLPSGPYPTAKLAYRVGNCVYMDLNHAGEPEKGICYGDRGEPMLVGDFDGNGTADLAVRRQGLLLIDTVGDGQGHETTLDLGDVGGASGFVVADFTGTADRRGHASVCVVRGDRCVLKGPAGAPGTERVIAAGQESFAGRWQKGGPARLGTRSGLCVDLDESGDDRPDKHLCYEDLATISEVLVGDWNGDGRDDLVLRRGGCVFVDLRLDGTHTESQCLEGKGASDYFVGSWDGK
jgi:hypothetical protein